MEIPNGFKAPPRYIWEKLPLASVEVQRMVDSDWSEEFWYQFDSVFIFGGDWYIHLCEDAGPPDNAMGEQLVIFRHGDLSVHYVDPRAPGFTLRLQLLRKRLGI